MLEVDETHAFDLCSWVESAQDPATDFPLQNLPIGMFQMADRSARPGMAIGECIVDLLAAADEGLLRGILVDDIRACAASGALNALFASGTTTLTVLRHAASALLAQHTEPAQRAERARERILVPQCDAQLLLPARVGDYTDFYASIHHATNVGSMFRPDNPLLPNYKWVPIGYHGRASSLVPSGTQIKRPSGQTKDDAAPMPSFGPTRRLDYELEIGAFIAAGNSSGSVIPLKDAESHIAGLCLVNDWSARDMQAWEYQPLGPFLAKNFATTVSPWVVSLDALAPFRAPAFERGAHDPDPLPYLADDANQRRGGLDITLEVLIASAAMRAQGLAPMRISHGNFTSMYWTIAQLVTHHASNGCNLLPGDLLASGTVSGPTEESRGCLLERTWRGTQPLSLPTGETRRFLEDGDEVIMRGCCERAGFRRIGFGECRGMIQSA